MLYHVFYFICYAFAKPTGFTGGVHKFTLNIVDLQLPGQMPHGHTCFNTLDLPRYTSKSEMETAINVALEHGAVGFAESGWE